MPGAGALGVGLLAGLPLLPLLLPLQGQVCLAVACQGPPPANPPMAAGAGCQQYGQAGLVCTRPRHWGRQRCRQAGLGQMLLLVVVKLGGLRLLRGQAGHMGGADHQR